jgi:hypothetical protein
MRYPKLLAAGLCLTAPAVSAQTNVPGDPYAGDPVGIGIAPPTPNPPTDRHGRCGSSTC